jgi:hypothetical protein
VGRGRVGAGIAGTAAGAAVLLWATTGGSEVAPTGARTPATSSCGQIGDRAPGWTRGGRIAFTRCLPSGRTVRLLIEPDGSRLGRFVPGTRVVRSRRSPDGTLVASIHRGGLFTSTPDGRFTRRVLQRRLAAAEPAWSRDGRWLAFVHPGGRAVLYVVRRDGLALRQLTGR